MRRTSAITTAGLSLLLLVCAEAAAEQSEPAIHAASGGARWVTVLDHRPPHTDPMGG